MLSEYKDCKFNIAEEQELINELEKVFNFYKEKKSKIEKEIKDEKKLFLFRFRKSKEMIQIYKIFELQTDILFNLIEYHKNPSPNSKQQKYFLKIKERGKNIIKFKKKEENLIVKRDPELDKIKFFYGENSNNIINNDSNNSIKNTFINTINDNFELRKDCHIIKNNTINFIPQLEINFSDNIEIIKRNDN